MKLHRIKHIFLISVLLCTSCNSITIDECDCKNMLIYGTPSEILSPIRISRSDVMKDKPIAINDKEAINKIISKIQNLEKIQNIDDIDKIDNRFVIEVKCNNGPDIIVGSNNYITRIDKSYFKPNNQFLNIISLLTKK